MIAQDIIGRLKSRGTFIRLSLSLLSSRDRVLFILVTFLTLFLALLDLLGVLLIGVVTSLSITGISTGQTGNRVSRVLEFLGIQALQFETQVVTLGLIAALLLILKTLLSMFLVRRMLFFMSRRAAKLSSDLVSRFLSIPVSQINRRSAQSSIYGLTNGVSLIMVGVFGTLVSLGSDLSLLLVLTIGLFVVDPITALGSTFLFGLIAYTLHIKMHLKMRDLGEKDAKLTIMSSQRIFEAVSAYRELLVRDRRYFYANEIGKLRFRLADGQAEISYMKNVSKYVLEIALVASAVLLAAYQFQSTSAFRAIATLSVFIAASTRLLPAILRIQQGVLSIKLSSAQAMPTFDLIREVSTVEVSMPRSMDLSRDHGDFSPIIALDKVSFSYDDPVPILQDIHLEIAPGEFVAIVGGSGAGKTTLVDVVLGALRPSSGVVKISSLAPEEAYGKWPGAVAYVPQDSPVIEGTIRDNLGLGFNKIDVLDEYCWESLRIARLEEFVRSLPDGLDTYVGDRGTSLSGGQRQRLGIARALITHPRLVILDEATSSLDAVTESEITDELRKLKGDVTLITVAHRLSTIVDADCVHFMKDGKIVGSGTFSELREKFPEFSVQAKLMGL